MEFDIDLSEIKKSVDSSMEKMNDLIKEIEHERNTIKDEIDKKIETLQFGKYDKEELSKFFEEPYVIIPKRENEYYVISPRWIDFSLGWLERRTKSYNIFVVNRYMQWIAAIPEILKQKLKFPDPLPFKIVNGHLLTGKEHQDKAWDKYKRFVRARYGKDRLVIKRGSEFRLLAQLIEDGILPFIPRPVKKGDLREWEGIALRFYQKRAWKEFLDKGAVGIFWAFGSGKSIFGLYALGRIEGNKLVVVPTLTLKEQWEERIESHLKDFKDEIEIVTYHGYKTLKNKEFSLVVFDECHRLPANTYIRLSTLNTQYRIGLSGSPFREDKRENYIFALTGFPIGMNWDELLKLNIVAKPSFKLYLLGDNRGKIRKLKELLKLPLKTLIFCDSIEFGEKIAKEFNLPFVYGATKGRMDIIRQSDVTVISRVGDEGISIPDLERVIEVSFLFGSRMQESQRFGRLMHSKKEEPEHIILMTEEEFEKYQKRLYAITERGFKLEIIR